MTNGTVSTGSVTILLVTGLISLTLAVGYSFYVQAGTNEKIAKVSQMVPKDNDVVKKQDKKKKQTEVTPTTSTATTAVLEEDVDVEKRSSPEALTKLQPPLYATNPVESPDISATASVAAADERTMMIALSSTEQLHEAAFDDRSTSAVEEIAPFEVNTPIVENPTTTDISESSQYQQDAALPDQSLEQTPIEQEVNPYQKLNEEESSTMAPEVAIDAHEEADEVPATSASEDKVNQHPELNKELEEMERPQDELTLMDSAQGQEMERNQMELTQSVMVIPEPDKTIKKLSITIPPVEELPKRKSATPSSHHVRELIEKYEAKRIGPQSPMRDQQHTTARPTTPSSIVRQWKVISEEKTPSPVRRARKAEQKDSPSTVSAGNDKSKAVASAVVDEDQSKVAPSATSNVGTQSKVLAAAASHKVKHAEAPRPKFLHHLPVSRSGALKDLNELVNPNSGPKIVADENKPSLASLPPVTPSSSSLSFVPGKDATHGSEKESSKQKVKASKTTKEPKEKKKFWRNVIGIVAHAGGPNKNHHH